MPPSAAPEWLRVGWIFETRATFAPASNASIAARIPAQPAPITRTSWAWSTTSEPTATLRLRARGNDVVAGVGEFLEVLSEHRGQSTRLLVVGGEVAPGRARIEQRLVDAGNRERHLEAEVPVDAVIDLVKPSRERRVEERPRRLDRHPVAVAERRRRPARPAGVDEPHVRPVLGELVAEHPGIDGRPLRQKRRPEAGGKRRLRLGDADLGAGELRGVAGEEVVPRLRVAEARD